jgi:hypothetical protein
MSAPLCAWCYGQLRRADLFHGVWVDQEDVREDALRAVAHEDIARLPLAEHEEDALDKLE